ncbi:ribosome-binding factor A [Bacilli bacterium]|nr:ribosome-binding factor A [Bacilli bacterium]
MHKELSPLTKRHLERLESEILNIINHAVKFNMYDNDFKKVSFTYVKITNDKSYATVYVDCYDDKLIDKMIKKLNDCNGIFRTELAHNMKLYRPPMIIFKKDITIAKSAKIEELLSK